MYRPYVGCSRYFLLWLGKSLGFKRFECFTFVSANGHVLEALGCWNPFKTIWANLSKWLKSWLLANQCFDGSLSLDSLSYRSFTVDPQYRHSFPNMFLWCVFPGLLAVPRQSHSCLVWMTYRTLSTKTCISRIEVKIWVLHIFPFSFGQLVCHLEKVRNQSSDQMPNVHSSWIPMIRTEYLHKK